MSGHIEARRPRHLLLLPVLAVLGTLLVSCGGGTPSSSSSRAAAPPGAQRPAAYGGAAAAGADHACVTPGSGPPTVDWQALRNPILSDPAAGEKDQALVWAGGVWHMLFSFVTGASPVPGSEHWDIASATSPDLVHWSAPVPWPDQAGVLGVASPDVVRSPSGTFVATYDSGPGSVGGGQAKLYYRTSPDLMQWSPPHPLAPDLHPGARQRMIDPALAWTGTGLVLGYKYGVGGASGPQHFEVAWSPSGSIDGPWRYVGRPDISVYGDTVENFEFVVAAGRWRLVATSNSFDQPWIFELMGNPRAPGSWLHWTGGRMLRLPGQTWDTGTGVSSVNYEHANSVYLCDARATDGYYYATYAGSDELTSFGGWGHAEIGIARSTDLVHWSVPG